MEMVAHVRAWFARKPSHTLLWDTLLAAVLSFALIPLTSSTSSSSTPGLLFVSNNYSLLFWSLPTFVPLMLRRYQPEIAAWLFVALTAAHLIFGPSMTYGDFYTLIILYSVLVYGNPKHSLRFIITAFAMGLAAAAVWAVSMNVGPLFKNGSSNAWTAWISWLPTAATMPTCPAPPGLISEPSVSTNCGIKLLRDTGVLALCMEISVLSIIIMALWQRARKATLTAMRERNDSIVAREAEETRIAALAERARIARDMHDVVAHTLSTIIVQSDGGRYAGAHDLELAKHTMGTIRHEAERAQYDMQRLFNVFGASGNTGYADIDSLFDGHLVVSRHVTGKAQPDRLSADAETAVFRLVQEALTNTRKHAGEGAKATIDEIWSADVLSITVSDNGQGTASAADGHKPGYGLVGMHERIEALGGNVQAGPGPNGGFIVAATIPLVPARSQDDSAPEDPALAVLSRMRGLLDSVRPKVLDQGDERESNWVGRFAQWTERHYLLMDVIATIVLFVLFDSATYGDLQMIGNAPYSPNRALTITLTIIMLSPLAFRRRFPEGSALAMAVLSALQLLFLPSILTINMYAMVSVYSAVLYGRESAWRWVSVALAADSWLAGIKVMTGWNGYSQLFRLLLPNGDSVFSKWRLVLSGLLPGVVIMLVGFACIAMARWSRSRGTNALVLLQREEALRAEQERQKVLAANLERNRISAAMQTEVLTTLESVIAQADEGLAMFNAEPAPDSVQIAAAFTAIGARGRAALAHMRQLLKVLRETGFSDETHEGVQPNMQLRPAASLDSQMREAREATAGANDGAESSPTATSASDGNSGNNQGVHGAALR
ncbi:histidine kinase [Bifidobacterium breve]|uniref:sensor histidine kinase n=2 Tax=Bifidobacterium breve TaxID=1685 RepID=UPI002164C1BD|nr:histidine kinase [Bifidobacterium breve]UVT06683.1 histidine kinase [Bifidobacterium breve]